MLKRLLAGVGVNIFDKLVVAGVQLALVPLLALHWGLEKYGTWLMLSTIPSFLAMGDLGLGTAAGSKMTMANARGDRVEVIRIFHSAWLAILISSLVFVMVAMALTWAVPARLFGQIHGMTESDLRLTLLLLLLYAIAAVQGSIFFAGFRAAEMFAVGAFWNAIIILIENTILIGGIVFLRAEPPVAAGALLIGRIIGLIGQNVLLRRTVPWLRIGLGEASRAELRSLVMPAGMVMILPIAQACLLQGTAFALAAAAGPVAVPAFTAARTLSRIGLQLCWTLNAAMMPEVSAALGRRDQRAISMLVFTMIFTSVLLSVPYALGFALFGKWAVTVWSGHVIVPPTSLVLTMALGIICVGLWFPMSNLLLAANQQQAYTVIFLALAALAVPVSYGLSKVIGATGAGLAMALTDLIMVLVIARLTQIHLATAREIRAAGADARVHARGMMLRFKR